MPLRLAWLFLFLAGLVHLPWRDKRNWLLLSPVLVYTAVGTFLFGGNMFGRFRLFMNPAEAYVVAVGGYGVLYSVYEAVSSRIRGNRRLVWRALWYAFIAVVFLAGIVVGRIAGSRGTRIFLVDFDSERSEPVLTAARAMKSGGTRLVASGGNTWLDLTGHLDQPYPQGIRILLGPEDYIHDTDYALSFDALLGKGSTLQVKVLGHPDAEASTLDTLRSDGRIVPYGKYEGQETRDLATVLGESSLLWRQSGQKWRRFSHFFMSPYSRHAYICIQLSLSPRDDPNAWARVDNIELRRTTLAERFAREYFSEATDRRGQDRRWFTRFPRHTAAERADKPPLPPDVDVIPCAMPFKPSPLLEQEMLYNGDFAVEPRAEWRVSRWGKGKGQAVLVDAPGSPERGKAVELTRPKGGIVCFQTVRALDHSVRNAVALASMDGWTSKSGEWFVIQLRCRTKNTEQKKHKLCYVDGAWRRVTVSLPLSQRATPDWIRVEAGRTGRTDARNVFDNVSLKLVRPEPGYFPGGEARAAKAYPSRR